MSEQHEKPETQMSRRSFLSSAAAASTAAIPVGLLAGTALAAGGNGNPLLAHPDAALLAKGDEFQLLFREYLGSFEPYDEGLCTAICHEVSELVHEIATMPATTLEGLAVKAMVARAQSSHPNLDFETTFEEHREFYGCSETMVAMSIARDLLRLKPEMAPTFEPVTPRTEI